MRARPHEVVRGEEHRATPLAVLADHGKDLLLHQRVKARRRLVEHQQLGLVEQRLDQTDLLAVAARELADPPVEIGLKPLRQHRPRPQAGHAARIGAELQELAPGEPRIAPKVAREVTQPRADLAARQMTVEPEDQRPPARRRVKQGKQRPDCRRLASPFGPRNPYTSPRSTVIETSSIPRAAP